MSLSNSHILQSRFPAFFRALHFIGDAASFLGGFGPQPWAVSELRPLAWDGGSACWVLELLLLEHVMCFISPE